MVQIGNVIVGLDILEREFVCDLTQCLGACCIEGDAGAPIHEEERQQLEKLIPIVWDDLSPAAHEVIRTQGVACIDIEGDLVTTTVENKDCVFTCYEPGGLCKCAIEKAYQAGKTDFCKPISCHLYPIRVSRYAGYTALNLHRWKICKCAEVLGRKEKIKVYQFLKGPLIRLFGKEWYRELELVAGEWAKRNDF